MYKNGEKILKMQNSVKYNEATVTKTEETKTDFKYKLSNTLQNCSD